MALIFPDTSNYILSQHFFIRLLGFTYFCAFWSLFVQVLGLYGEKGIIPIKQTLEAYRKSFKKGHYLFYIPSLFWFISSDLYLRLLAALGMIFSIVVMSDHMTPLFLFLLWIIYLSYTNLGVVFLSFQWDALLLEVGFIGFLFSIMSPPPILLLVALWVLLFRFMVASGLVKLLSGCPEWRKCRAMRVHYETQPLPNRMAYYFHQFPKWFSQCSELSIYFFEVITPFLIFGTDFSRLIAFCLLVFFQFLIALTGNYAFFNLLSVVLCIPLLTNSSLNWMTNFQHENFAFAPLEYVLNSIGLILIILNLYQLVRLYIHIPFFERILSYIAPYYISNSYGLFAVMTTERNEIVIEGSDDGIEWKEYEFKWKPGDIKSPPKQVAPYHPRLDWQMWFAALGSYRSNPWIISLLKRLLEGSKVVEDFFKVNPFKSKPPKYIRAVAFQYHFSDLETKKRTGAWWVRAPIGDYTPTLSLENEDNKYDGIVF